MTDAKVGFEIQGKFYPWVGLDSWKTKESRVARHVAGCNLRTLLTGGSDNNAINMAFAAVAFWRGNPDAEESDVIQVMDELTAADVKLVGFDPVDEGDARPPDGDPGTEPSEPGETSSESSSEKSPRKTSGSRP